MNLNPIVKILGSSSGGNAILLSDGGDTNLLLDCGLSARTLREKLGHGLDRITACLVTHSHRDHAMAIPDLLRASVHVYATEPTLGCYATHHNAVTIRSGMECDIGTWRVAIFPTFHDVEQPVGFLLDSSKFKGRICYAVDTGELPYLFPGLGYALIEANYDEDALDAALVAGEISRGQYDRIIINHLSHAQADEFCEKNGIREEDRWYLHQSRRHKNWRVVVSNGENAPA